MIEGQTFRRLSNDRAKLSQRAGYTLVEISMVLVIIGFVVSGVFVGKELFAVSEMRAEMSQVDKFNVAVGAFKLKYGCLPGDCSNATQFFAASSQPERVTNGNGNGIIERGGPLSDYAFSWVYGLREWKYMFDQLSAAGLVELQQYDETNPTSSNNRAGYAYPRCKMTNRGVWVAGSVTIAGGDDCGVIFSYEFDGHYARLGAHGDRISYTNTGFWAGFSPNVALRLDTKFDDGFPLSGSIQAAAVGEQAVNGGLPAGCGPDGTDLTACVTAYGVANSNRPCTNVAMTAYNNTGANANHMFCSLRIRARF